MKLLSNYITLNIFIIFVLLYRQHTSCVCVRALARMYLVSPGTVTAGEQLGIMCSQ